MDTWNASPMDTDQRHRYHVAIDTPTGRWLQADFQTLGDLWAWVSSETESLRAIYGQHEWFKIRVEEFRL
jgi:hypothetical protein